MTPFIIDDNTKKAIARIKKHAELNVYTIEDMKAILKGNESKIAGNQDNFVAHLPFGYKVVYSVEEQKIGRMRHLSLSRKNDNENVTPPSIVVEQIMKMIGFTNSFEQCKKKGFVYVEKNETESVNVLEIIN